MSSRRPIGIFDSGVGGLTVFREVSRLLPGEDIVYFGDTARVPYGTKSRTTITRFSLENAVFLLRFGVKLIIVACNTSSSLALPQLKRRFPIPVIGVIEPGARAALECTRNLRIGVIGTPSTIGSGVYERVLKKMNPSAKVFSRACPLFVALVEEGWLRHRVSHEVAGEYLRPLKRAGVDTLILGCTHYPLLKPVLQRIMGKKVTLVDSAGETARIACRLLEEKKILAERKADHVYRFFVSDEPARFVRAGRMFLPKGLNSVKRVKDYV